MSIDRVGGDEQEHKWDGCAVPEKTLVVLKGDGKHLINKQTNKPSFSNLIGQVLNEKKIKKKQKKQ